MSSSELAEVPKIWICRFSICFRSESTLKSIKLQYGAEIDGWRAKYEEAQVRNQNMRRTKQTLPEAQRTQGIASKT